MACAFGSDSGAQAVLNRSKRHAERFALSRRAVTKAITCVALHAPGCAGAQRAHFPERGLSLRPAACQWTPGPALKIRLQSSSPDGLRQGNSRPGFRPIQNCCAWPRSENMTGSHVPMRAMAGSSSAAWLCFFASPCQLRFGNTCCWCPASPISHPEVSRESFGSFCRHRCAAKQTTRTPWLQRLDFTRAVPAALRLHR